MLTKYLDAAMKKAQYEIIEDGTFWGNIPGFDGLWGNAPTLEECRTELKETLEEWLLLKLWLHHDNIPVVERIRLAPPKRALAKESHGTAGSARHRKAS
jgi:predicted RNase H-like HicB family nuclease